MAYSSISGLSCYQIKFECRTWPPALTFENQVAAFEAMSARQAAAIERSMERADLEEWKESAHGAAVIQDFLNKHRRNT